MTLVALQALEAQARADLHYLNAPDAAWVKPLEADGHPVLDVVVVGGGLSGLGIAHGLQREQVRNIVVIDKAEAGQEGPWLSYARMPTLRTAKALIGPDLGMPSLSFPAWFTASFGSDAWDALTLAPVQTFVDYLRWFRRVADIPVRNDVELLEVAPHACGLVLQVNVEGRREQWYTRKLVLATGLAAGGAVLPVQVTTAVPAHQRAHSSDPIDFHALRGKRVAVLGAGASAFDNAAMALEHGAAAVTLYARRASIEQPAIRAPLENAGLYRHYPLLSDAQRWRIMRLLARHSTPPPPYSVERCTRHAAFTLHVSCPWQQVQWHDGVIQLHTPAGVHEADFIILATGFSIDVAQRPELRDLHPSIARWQDVYAPPADDRPDVVAALAASPYLGTAFEYQAKPGHDAPWLSHVHDFGLAGLLSMGRISQGIPGMRFGPERLVHGITQALFLADADWHEANLLQADAQAAAATPDPSSVV